MTVRVEVVTPCEHGEWNPHRSGDGEITATSDGAEIMAVMCRGASRKAFTEWPPEAIEAAAFSMHCVEEGAQAASHYRELAEAAFDALLGVLEEHVPGVGEALDYFDEMGGNTPYGAEIAFDCLNDTQQEAIIRAARLLAVLREETQ